jgi:two-component SAPR family response regulator
MRVERGDAPVRRWGGEKAGSRQAQAIFAFLFDRGEAGVTKDEVTELLWPDLEIRRADLAFHRTLGGLRAVLEQGREPSSSITFNGGRYRLALTIVEWSDVDTFEELMDQAGAHDGVASVAVLEQARSLYRGDLFDDCPFYGDSSYAEERRAYLRGRYEDLLVRLGDCYSQLGDPTAAAARYRQALGVNPESPAARSGLDRIGAAEGVKPA